MSSCMCSCGIAEAPSLRSIDVPGVLCLLQQHSSRSAACVPVKGIVFYCVAWLLHQVACAAAGGVLVTFV
jgi:hypothetical protein